MSKVWFAGNFGIVLSNVRLDDYLSHTLLKQKVDGEILKEKLRGFLTMMYVPSMSRHERILPFICLSFTFF
jgi:hypothetical protein